MKGWRYTTALLVAGLALPGLGLFSLNALMDPFGIWGTAMPGVNENKPDEMAYLRMRKAFAVRRHAGPNLLMGSSRVLLGIDPVGSAWGDGTAYNLAVPAPTMAEQQLFLELAHAVRPVERLAYGLDFIFFNAAYHNEPFEPEAFPELRPGSAAQWKRIQVTASPSTASLSLTTFAARNEDRAWRFESSGFYARNAKVANPSRRANQHKAFLRHTRNYARSYFGTYYSIQTNRFEFAHESGRTTLDEFADFVNYCHAEGIETSLFIPPVHAVQLETIDTIGLWPLFEHWKRAITSINAKVAADHDAAPFPLIDFSGYSVYTTEPIPVLGDIETPMRYYHDCSHYRPALGDLMLKRLARAEVDDSFGRSLTPETVASVLLAIRDERKAWRERFPEVSEFWRGVAREAMPEGVYIQPVG